MVCVFHTELDSFFTPRVLVKRVACFGKIKLTKEKGLCVTCWFCHWLSLTTAAPALICKAQQPIRVV